MEAEAPARTTCTYWPPAYLKIVGYRVGLDGPLTQVTTAPAFTGSNGFEAS